MHITLLVAKGLVRVATRMAPPEWRERVVSEWHAELERESRQMGAWALLRASAGVLADARALRRIERARGMGMTGEGFMTGWLDDMRVAIRSLWRVPGFTAVAVLTLALGIGGTTAIFSVLDRVVLDPLPYPDADRLVRLENQVPGVAPDARWALSTAQFVFFGDEAARIEAIGLYRYVGGNVMTTTGPLRVDGIRVTESMMDLLGARARAGRLITPADDERGAARVTLLSHGFWMRELGGAADVVGTTLTFDDEPVEIIGVLEPGIELPGWPSTLAPDLWMPMQVNRTGNFANSHGYPAVARLTAGSDAAELQADLERMTARLPELFPRAYGGSFIENYGFRPEVTPLKKHVIGDMDKNLWLLFAGVGLVLVVACTNGLNLLLVRGEVRRREVAVRAALGARRTHLIRYALTEALALAVAGGVLGLLIGYWTVPALVAMAPDDLPRISGLGFGVESVLFTLGLSLFVGVGVGVLSLVVGRVRGTMDGLFADGRGSTVGKGGTRARSALVVGQVALALTLTVSAAVVLETLRGLWATDPGFEPDGVATLHLYLGPGQYPDDESAWAFHRELLERVRALPGVAEVGMGEELPVSGSFGCTVQYFEDTSIHDRLREEGLTTCAGQTQVTPGYFETLGIPVLAGRVLEGGDNDDPTRGSVVVSRAFADRFWPGQDPIGRGVNPSGRSIEPFYTVVGVVGDVPAASAEGQAPLSQPAMAIYYPTIDNPDAGGNWGWSWTGSMSLVVKAQSGDPLDLVPAVRSVIRELDPEVPVGEVQQMGWIVASAMGAISFVSLLLAIAAALALTLSAVGLYGTVSYWVGSRTREIGMRLAIGARPEDVLKQVVGTSMRLALLGLALGLGGAVVTSGALERLLVGVEGAGAIAYGTSLTLLGLVTVFASWLPARRAAAVDPAEALRAE